MGTFNGTVTGSSGGLGEGIVGSSGCVATGAPLAGQQPRESGPIVLNAFPGAG